MPMMKGSMGAKRSGGYPTSPAARMRATQEGRRTAGFPPPKPKVDGSMVGKAPAKKPTPVGALANATKRGGK